MPRNMSFMLTVEQFRNRTKTVTRRVNWAFLRPGDVLNGCVKCQGLQKGEKVQKLGQIRVVSVRREPLNSITKEECVKEGFPNMEPAEFIQMFLKANKGAGLRPGDDITRIEFEYLDITQT